MRKKKTAAAPDLPGKIYVFSNVEYPEERKLEVGPNDLLIFLNKAASSSYYADAPCRKEVWRRTASADYGVDVPGCVNRCVFDSTPDGPAMPAEFIDDLKAHYDWNYPIKQGKTRCMTTGYMVVKYLQAQYPDRELVLVNFGFAVAKSTYRCPWHNWDFEAAELGKLPHVFTAELRTPPEFVYCADANYLPQVEMSAASVLRFNPDAHITIVSASPLETKFENIVVDCSAYKFRPQRSGHLSEAAYLKLLLPDALKLDKCIYLDGDTLCRGSIAELWATPVDFIGLCHSHDAGIRQAQQIGADLYGLTAVMLLNLNALREVNFTAITLYAQEHFRFPATPWYCDETVINCCFGDRFTFLPLRWCWCVDRRYDAYPDRIDPRTAVIAHYIGGNRAKQREDFDRMMRQ